MSRILGIARTARTPGRPRPFGRSRFLRQRVGVFLTSIGYDGEDTDTVTSLPKVVVGEGDMVATALHYLNAGGLRA